MIKHMDAAEHDAALRVADLISGWRRKKRSG